jgi:hypothetical protein
MTAQKNGAWHQFPIFSGQEFQWLRNWCLAPISDLTRISDLKPEGRPHLKLLA